MRLLRYPRLRTDGAVALHPPPTEEALPEPPDLVRLLTWQDEPYDRHDPWSVRDELVLARFARLPASMTWLLDRAEIERILAETSSSTLRETLLRVGVAEEVLGFRPGRERRLLNILRRELAFGNRRTPPPDGSWNQSQTLRVVDGRIVAQSFPTGHGVELVARGPLLEGSRSDNRILDGPYQPFTPEELERVRTTLQTSLDLIASVPSPTRHYVFDCLRVIYLRKFGEEREPHSNCRTSRIGWIFLGNPHLPEFTVGRCVEMLLHEALHHYLSLREFSGPLVEESYPEAESILSSPWTDRPLTERNLSHAIFIWFGLAQFFRRFGEQGLLEGAEQSRLPLFEGGFHKGPIIELFSRAEALSHKLRGDFARIDEAMLPQQSR